MLTDEQQNIVISDGNIRGMALAGTGKTSTALAWMRAHTGVPVLYLAYNRSIAAELHAKTANMPHVRVSTIHALAREHIRPAGEPGRLPLDFFSRMVPGWPEEGVKALQMRFTQFCHSDAMDMESFSFYPWLPKAGGQMFRADIDGDILFRCWQMATSPNCPIADHDVYLKRWQLSGTNIASINIWLNGAIIIDEAQDMSPVMEACFREHPRILLFGDPYQRIYGFRGSIDSLAHFDFPIHPLTRSFRCAPDIAKTALGYLRLMGYDGPYEGHGQTEKQTGPHAFLHRTVNGMWRRFFQLLDEGVPVRDIFLPQGAEGHLRLLNAMCRHAKGLTPLHPLFDEGGSWDDIQKKAEAGGEDGLSSLLRLLPVFTPSWLLEMTETIEKEGLAENMEKARYVISTAHKAKGLEFHEVTIADDFLSSPPEVTSFSIKKDGNHRNEKFADARLPRSLSQKKCLKSITVDSEELRLLYVAVTRAKNILHLPLPQSPQKLKSAFQNGQICLDTEKNYYRIPEKNTSTSMSCHV